MKVTWKERELEISVGAIVGKLDDAALVKYATVAVESEVASVAKKYMRKDFISDAQVQEHVDAYELGSKVGRIVDPMAKARRAALKLVEKTGMDADTLKRLIDEAASE